MWVRHPARPRRIRGFLLSCLYRVRLLLLLLLYILFLHVIGVFSKCSAAAYIPMYYIPTARRNFYLFFFEFKRVLCVYAHRYIYIYILFFAKLRDCHRMGGPRARRMAWRCCRGPAVFMYTRRGLIIIVFIA